MRVANLFTGLSASSPSSDGVFFERGEEKWSGCFVRQHTHEVSIPFADQHKLKVNNWLLSGGPVNCGDIFGAGPDFSLSFCMSGRTAEI